MTTICKMTTHATYDAIAEEMWRLHDGPPPLVEVDEENRTVIIDDSEVSTETPDELATRLRAAGLVE